MQLRQEDGQAAVSGGDGRQWRRQATGVHARAGTAIGHGISRIKPVRGMQGAGGSR